MHHTLRLYGQHQHRLIHLYISLAEVDESSCYREIGAMGSEYLCSPWSQRVLSYSI